MPTICELTLQLKQKGIKGYSGKNKAQLLNMLANKYNTIQFGGELNISS